MSIVTGRRLNKFYKELSKSFENIEKKLENVLYSTETDKYIFSDSKSGFVPKTGRKYDDENRYLRADGKWSYPTANNELLAYVQGYSIGSRDADVTEYIHPSNINAFKYDASIMLVSVYKISDIGSVIGAMTLVASYAYSVTISSVIDSSLDYYKEIVKIAALNSGISSTYGTITAVDQSSEDNYGTIMVKVKKGYIIRIKFIC